MNQTLKYNYFLIFLISLIGCSNNSKKNRQLEDFTRSGLRKITYHENLASINAIKNRYSTIMIISKL